jgi:F-type H+-transporting ATPase subunit epsilon
MPGVFSLSVLTPEKNLFTGEAAEIIFSTSVGRVGMMAGHSPMFAEVTEGIMEILVGDEWKVAAVGQGFGEIAYNNAEFFVDTAEWADEIDAARAKEALERAASRIRGSISRVEYLRTQAAMSGPWARLKCAGSKTSRKK